jgi:hypothetical protein
MEQSCYTNKFVDSYNLTFQPIRRLQGHIPEIYHHPLQSAIFDKTQYLVALIVLFSLWCQMK